MLLYNEVFYLKVSDSVRGLKLKWCVSHSDVLVCCLSSQRGCSERTEEAEQVAYHLSVSSSIVTNSLSWFSESS